jgi:type I restriction enzyme S subunit
LCRAGHSPAVRRGSDGEPRMKNAPKLRFKDENGRDFPAWEKKKLGDICSRIMDGTHFSPKSKEGSKKYITSKNIRNEGLDLSNIKYISDDDHKDIYKKCPVKFGDVLLTKDGENTGNCCLNTLHEEFSLLSSVAVINGLPSILSNIFLLQVLKSKKGIGSITGAMAGQAITRITLEKIKNFIFDFPSYPEQTKIANFLTAIDDRITQLTQKVDGLQQYKKAVMQQIFSQKLRFKDEKGRAFGAWDKDNLLNLSEEGFTNGVFNDPKKTGRGYKLINVLDMYIDSTIDEKRLSLVELSDAEFKKNKVEHGEIFFTRSSLVKSGIAHSNIYLGDSQDVTFDGHLIRMRPRKNLINPIFLNYLLKTPEVRKQLVARGKTATMTTIGQADIAAVTVEFPSLPEQAKIAGFLGAVDEKLAQAKAKLDAVKQYKQGLLQQMFV